MLSEELSQTVLGLPVAERLELARRLVESVVSPAPVSQAFLDGIRRIDDVAAGRTTGLTEEEFRAALQ